MNGIALAALALSSWSLGVVYGGYKAERRGKNRTVRQLLHDLRNYQ